MIAHSFDELVEKLQELLTRSPIGKDGAFELADLASEYDLNPNQVLFLMAWFKVHDQRVTALIKPR